MPALTRKFKKIFGKDSTKNGVFGSAAILSPAVSTDPETIESLTAFLNGWEDATEGGLKLPTLQDLQGLKYDTDYHLAYIYQTGMQVYDSQTTYYATDLVRKNATTEIWKSLVDDNAGNSLVSGVNWSLVGNLSNIPSSPINSVKFRVYRDTSVQTIPTATPTKIQLNAETFDTNNYFDSTTNYRFTPLIAGYYQFSGTCSITGITGNRIEAMIYKNGSKTAGGSSSPTVGTGDMISVVNDLIYMNGSTDYVELYVIQYSSDGNESLQNGSGATFFYGYLIY